MPTPTTIHDAGWAFTDDRRVESALTMFLQSLPAKPLLLGLGEPMHVEDAFPRLRNRVFQHLVEHEGYRSIAIESDCVAGLMVDDFIAGVAGSFDEVMQRGFSYGFRDVAANRELIQWMREYNHDRPAGDRLRFFGFDAPIDMSGADSPRTALTALHGYLSAHIDANLITCAFDVIDHLIGDDTRWSNPEASMDPSKAVGSSADVAELRLITDDLLTLLASASPHLIASTSRDDWWLACMYGRTAAGLLRYHVAMADASSARLERLLALRDVMMAGNLTAIAENQAQRGPILVFAHNRHLQKAMARWLLPPGWGPLEGQTLEWWCAGAIVDAQLGDRYAVVASDVGAAKHRGLGAPRADTLEGILSALPEHRYLIPSERLAAALDDVDVAPRTDSSSDFSYLPLDPDQLHGTDGVVFIRRIPAPTST